MNGCKLLVAIAAAAAFNRPSLAPRDIYHARGARPDDHVINYIAPEGIIIIHKICITLYTLYYYKVR